MDEDYQDYGKRFHILEKTKERRKTTNIKTLTTFTNTPKGKKKEKKEENNNKISHYN